MKVAINAGHTKQGPGFGAIGLLKESEQTRKVVNELLVHFRRKGHTAINCTVDKAASQNDYLRQTVALANASRAELFLSVHFNCGGGRGTECYTYKGKQLKSAVNICENLNIIGFKNRGVKDGSKLYVVKNTNMTAILIEVCFIDSLLDIDLYEVAGPKLIAQAIYDAVIN